MLIRLEKSYLGREIIDAFQRAILFQVSSTKKWVGKEIECDFQGGGGSLKPTKIGVEVCPYSFKREIFFRSKKWIEDKSSMHLRLFPISPSGEHDKVYVHIWYFADMITWYESVYVQPDSDEYTFFKPMFEKMLSNFYYFLQNQA